MDWFVRAERRQAQELNSVQRELQRVVELMHRFSMLQRNDHCVVHIEVATNCE